jgi:hypothetical protein
VGFIGSQDDAGRAETVDGRLAVAAGATDQAPAARVGSGIAVVIEADFYIEDFAQKKLNIFQFESDISVVSATLEHIDDYEQFLSNVFETTGQLVLIRTFIGERSEMDYCLKEGATQSYLIRQFVLSDLVNNSFNKDWLFEEIIDEATLSKPKVICNSITRSQQILKFVKK